jgi:hypothetical protein
VVPRSAADLTLGLVNEALSSASRWKRVASVPAMLGHRVCSNEDPPGLGIAVPNAELTGRQREDARPGPQTMYRAPAARAWWPAVGAPVERPVRRRSLRINFRARCDRH